MRSARSFSSDTLSVSFIRVAATSGKPLVLLYSVGKFGWQGRLTKWVARRQTVADSVRFSD